MVAYIFSILSIIADQLIVLFFIKEYGRFRGSFLKANLIIDSVLILEHTIFVFGLGLSQGGLIVSTFDTLFLLFSWIWLCNENIYKRFILLVIFIITALIGEGCTCAVMMGGFHLTMEDMHGYTIYTMLAKILVLDEMFILYICIAIFIKFKKERYKIRYLCSIFFTVATHYGFQICLMYLDLNEMTPEKILCFQFFQLILLAVVLQQYLYFLRQHDFSLKETEMQGLKLEMKNNYQYYLLATEQFDEASRIRHDYNNQIQSIQYMLDNHQIDEARELLHSCSDIHRTKLISFCSIPIINVVLTIKTNVARNLGIETQCILQNSDQLELNNYELCSLFSNLLDNAIEACQQSGNSYRYIEIKGKAISQSYILRIENNCILQNKPNESFPKSTKHQPGHGYGLKIVQNITESHGGNFNLTIRQNCAIATLNLPLKVNVISKSN